jgi:branched-chain amino acid transport system substrate-binding protein
MSNTLKDKRRVFQTLISITIILLILTAACGPAATEPVKEEEAVETLQIGAALSLTGALTNPGNQMKKGYDLWVEVVNEQGGIKVGDTTYMIEIIYYDDQSDSTTATKLTEKLITEDGVEFIFGPFGSGITEATSAITEKYQVPMIAPLANADPVYARGFVYLFGILPPISMGPPDHLRLLSELPNPPNTVAIITPDDLFPSIAAEAFQRIGEELGMEIVAFEKHPKDATDLSAVLAEIKAESPDVILTSGYFENYLAIVRGAKELRINPLYMGGVGTVDMPDWVDTLGNDAEFTTGHSWWSHVAQWTDPVFGSAEEYSRLFQEKYGEVPEYHSAAASAAGVVFQNALETAGTLDKDKVRDAIRNTDLETFFGPVKYNDAGLNITGRGVIVQIQNGEPITVWPPDTREEELMYPMTPWDER